MNELFFPLFAGHLIADFWLQPTSWVLHKKENGWRSGKLIIHTAIASVVPVLFTFQVKLWWLIPIIFLTHYLIDLIKTFTKENMASFLVDQLLHIGILWILAGLLPATGTPTDRSLWWIYACGFILVTSPLGILTGMFLKSVTQTKNSSPRMDASAWIGIMERILIVIFVVTNHFEAIGFLVAAKSVFRFSDTQKDGNQKAEYFLLGTLVSFSLAIIVGIGLNFLINLKI